MSDAELVKLVEGVRDVIRAGTYTRLRPALDAATLDRAITALSSQDDVTDGALEKPAQIGSTVFGVGVKHTTVVGRAQREYEYQQALKSKPTTEERRTGVEVKQGLEEWARSVFPIRIGTSIRETVYSDHFIALAMEIESYIRRELEKIKKPKSTGHLALLEFQRRQRIRK